MSVEILTFQDDDNYLDITVTGTTVIGIYIDNKELSSPTLTVNLHPVFVETDDWENGAYKREVITLGIYKTLNIEAYEETSTPWTDSIVKYLQDKILNAEEVKLLIAHSLYNQETSVYIKELTAEMKEKTRRYRVMLQEATI